MTSRRRFMETSFLSSLALICARPMQALQALKNEQGQVDWAEIRLQYPILNWDKIYLNSGSAGVVPRVVRDQLIDLITYVTEKAPYAVWKEWQPIKKKNLERLGDLIGADASELQVVRNTTEALNMIIYGLPLIAEDEVIIATSDYPFAHNAWTNRADRDGVVLRSLDLSLPATDEEVVAAYREAITPQTKVFHLTHVTHREGHILPIKALTELAHSHDIQVVVDGAHAVAHIPVDLHDYNCDYYGSSLHKWLTAPLGTGLLYVRKDRLESLLPHPSSGQNVHNSMDRYEHLGTRQWANEIAIGAALDYMDVIGVEVRYDRLMHLKKYWTDQLQDMPRVTFITDLDDRYSGAISTVQIEGYAGGQLVQLLDRDYNIHVKSVSGAWGSGIRVSPNLFVSEEDLDQLVVALKKIATA